MNFPVEIIGWGGKLLNIYNRLDSREALNGLRISVGHNDRRPDVVKAVEKLRINYRCPINQRRQIEIGNREDEMRIGVVRGGKGVDG